MLKKAIIISMFSLMLIGCSNQTRTTVKTNKTSEEINRERLINLAIEKNREKAELERLKKLNKKEIYEELVKINKELNKKSLNSFEKKKLEEKIKILEQANKNK